jgi:hypothetical protein
MQEPQYLGKITLVLIWFRMVLTQIITHVYRDSVNLDDPIKYQHSTVIRFLCYIGSLIPLLMLTIHTKHSPIYQSNIGVKVMEQRSRALHLSLNLLYCFASPFFLLILRMEVAFCKDCTGLLCSTLPLNPYFSHLQCAILAAEKSLMLLSIRQSWQP